MSSFPPRCTILGQLALGAWLILAGTGNWAHAHSAQVLSWYSAFLPLLVFLAILFFSDWLGEYVMGSWGVWEARRDLSRLAEGLAVLETWRLGGGFTQVVGYQTSPDNSGAFGWFKVCVNDGFYGWGEKG